MFKVNYCKVIGFQQALDVLKASGADMPFDSYTTYIEDPDAMEMAPFQFVLGEGDMEALKKDTVLFNRFLDSIMVYVGYVTDNSDIGYMLDKPCVSYGKLCRDTAKPWCDLVGHDEIALVNWILSLPYMQDFFDTMEES